MASRHGLVTLAFGDGEYDFRLSLGDIEELEGKTDKSIFLIAAAMQAKIARSTEIRETLRIGLIGGGTKPVDASALVKRYVDERSLHESQDTAYAVVLAALWRVHGDKMNDDQEDDAQAGKESASTSPPSEGTQ